MRFIQFDMSKCVTIVNLEVHVFRTLFYKSTYEIAARTICTPRSYYIKSELTHTQSMFIDTFGPKKRIISQIRIFRSSQHCTYVFMVINAKQERNPCRKNHMFANQKSEIKQTDPAHGKFPINSIWVYSPKMFFCSLLIMLIFVLSSLLLFCYSVFFVYFGGLLSKYMHTEFRFASYLFMCLFVYKLAINFNFKMAKWIPNGKCLKFCCCCCCWNNTNVFYPNFWPIYQCLLMFYEFIYPLITSTDITCHLTVSVTVKRINFGSVNVCG